MSSGTTEFLDWTGPVEKDTTVTCSGKRWNSTSPVGDVSKSTVGIVIPIVPFTVLPQQCFGIMVQFNYTAPQPFSLVDWNSIVNQVALSTMGLFLAVRYRVGNVSVRYRLCGDLPIVFGPPITFSGGGRNIIPAPLYNGQLIKQQFCLECWQNTLIAGTNNFSIPTSMILQTSILSTPSPFITSGPTASIPSITGTQTSNLFTPFGTNFPLSFGDSAWNSN